jgi:hypothetical protein
MIENQEKILYGLKNNRDVFFCRNVLGGGALALGFDNYRNLKLFISSVGATRYEKGSVIAVSKDEFQVFLEKYQRIAEKMKVCVICILRQTNGL